MGFQTRPNLFRISNDKNEKWTIISLPLSSANKSECAGSIPSNIDDNCVIIVKYTMTNEMKILRDSFHEHFKNFSGLASSFFESCFIELFNSFTDGIYKKRLCDNFEVDVDSIIDLAGKNFMWTISTLLDGDLDESEVTSNNHAGMLMIMQKHKKALAYNIEKISTLAYEKNEAFGCFLFTQKNSIE